MDRAVLISPFDSILWMLYARVEAELGNHARARAMFNRAVELNPKDWYVNFHGTAFIFEKLLD